MQIVNSTIVEIKHPSLKFDSAHFTIFSKTSRENLHGHNYSVAIKLITDYPKDGLNFDYRQYREMILKHCQQLDKTLLLPLHSPFLEIQENDKYVICTFNNKEMPFLTEDITLLPISNITIEELSRWFLTKILENKQQLSSDKIQKITVQVFNSPAQSASVSWDAN